MTGDLTPYVFDDHQVRAGLDADGQPWFVHADVCRALGIANPSDALNRLDRDGLGTTEAIDAMGRPQQMATIDEGAVYQLVFSSRRPEAAAFRRWVTREVLPAIRRTGMYAVPDPVPALAAPTTMVEALRLALAQHERADAAEARVAELEPAARFAHDYLAARADMSVDDAAGRLQRAGVDTGPRVLWQQLHALGWAHRSREDGGWRASAKATLGCWLTEWDTGQSYLRRGHRVAAAPQVRVTPTGLRRLGEVLVVDALDLDVLP